MTPGIHPFPARMAPELALKALHGLPPSSLVLDPMTGSGTVARQAIALGHNAKAFDLDPLAVLISKVSVTSIEPEEFSRGAAELEELARTLAPQTPQLRWVDEDDKAKAFIDYWFAPTQQKPLRALAYLLESEDEFQVSESVRNALRIAVSRLIVTKHQCASLAQDTSHSRPHRVAVDSDYDVFKGLKQSVKLLSKRLPQIQTEAIANISLGDARHLINIEDSSVDAILTSPPYLNAIDYLRGHRLSLIWLGHRLSDITQARSASIGSERKADKIFDLNIHGPIRDRIGDISSLPARFHGMIDRYVIDLFDLLAEAFRVLKTGATATFVMGDSCLRGIFILNSEALSAAATGCGLKLASRVERDLLSQHRYLPTPATGALGKRMRKEVILSFQKT